MLRRIHTRFRAYQLGAPGSSFSYLAGDHFTVLEGRLTSKSRPSLIAEMDACRVRGADTLHITSWDQDHCSASELVALLELTSPKTIEYPGYPPKTENGQLCLEILLDFAKAYTRENWPRKITPVTPGFIASLPRAEELAFQHIFYNPIHIDQDCGNNNSTVKQFRTGSFNVLSLGDVECPNISARIRRCRMLQLETDVMILAHHGAENGFTNKNLLERLRPTLAVCSSNYNNQFDHPRQNVRQLLDEHRVKLMTTKTGDIVVHSLPPHEGTFQAINLIANSTQVSSAYQFKAKKAALLSNNADTIRQIYRPVIRFRGS